MNCILELFEVCVVFVKCGGMIDFIVSEDFDFWEKIDGEVCFSKVLKWLIEEDVFLDNFMMILDG